MRYSTINLFQFVFAAVILVSFGLFLRDSLLLRERIAYETAEKTASHINDSVQSLHETYSNDVVAPLRTYHPDVVFSHEYQMFDGALPAPGTLATEFSQGFNDWSNVTDVRFYSQYPFPRVNIGRDGQLMQIEVEALGWLEQNPDTHFQKEIVDEYGERSLVFAFPSVMQESCVACHNNHPQSPRQDWEVGDVRGAFLVVQPLNSPSLIPETWTQNYSFLVGIIALVGFYFILAFYQARSEKMLELRTAELELEIRQRKRIEVQLNNAKLDAEEANRAKSTFLANMTHELRTPLNAILGFAQVIGKDGHRTSADQQHLEVIDQSGKHLLSMINEVLDMSKIESGKVDINKSAFDLIELIQNTCAMFEPQADRKRIKIRLEIHDGEIPELIVADEQKLRQILINLIGNAVKFTNRGEILIGVWSTKEKESDTNYLNIAVKDSGRGISSAEVERLFTPFERGRDSYPQVEGAGLGLSISRNFARLLDGDIEVESVLGKGSTFTVTFPFETADLSMPAGVTMKPAKLTAARRPPKIEEPALGLLEDDVWREIYRASLNLEMNTLQTIFDKSALVAPQLIEVMRDMLDRFAYDEIEALCEMAVGASGLLDPTQLDDALVEG